MMPADSENWDRLQTLFYLAEATPAEDRDRVLAEQCVDSSLVQEALALISGSETLSRRTPAPPQPFTSTRVGPYLLLRLLGSGGIGTVYLAERMRGGAPQRVALKMLAPHAAGASFIERFDREQHILSSLDHPNITRLIDAGFSESKQPYLVMEYVDGEHLDAYCDHRRLAVQQRLGLFLAVCEAVAYAHRNLIVHLDLKPSNILVSQEGTAKLLDFGASKLIQPDSPRTTTVMATPSYSSPEQLRNEPVTTACDVYSLGAILFELLTGRRPYANSSVAAMIEHAVLGQRSEDMLDSIALEAAAARGVTMPRLRQLLAGDLQTIVRKCLELRPADRYPSVDALAQDVKRYLEGDPILARPQTMWYRLGKFVRRHRAGFAASVSAVVILIGAFSYAFWRQQQALHEAQRAERMQVFMHQLFKMANPKYTARPQVTVPEFLQFGVKILPEYIHNPEDQLQAKVSLAESMYYNGDLDDAANVFQQCAESAARLNDVDAQTKSTAFLGHIRFWQGNIDAGMKLTAEALSLSRHKGVTATERIWAAGFYAYDREKYVSMSDETLAVARSAVEEARRSDLAPHEEAQILVNFAAMLTQRHAFDEAKSVLSEALPLLNHGSLDLCDQAVVYQNLGYIDFLNNDAAAGVPLMQRAYDDSRSCSGASSHYTLAMLAYLGEGMVEAGRSRDAVKLLEAYRADWEKTPGGLLILSEFPQDLSIAYNATGRYPDAEKLISALIAAKHEQSPAAVLGRPELILAQALAGEHDYKEALPHADAALRALSQRNPKIMPSPFDDRSKAVAEQCDADIRTQLGLPPLP